MFGVVVERGEGLDIVDGVATCRVDSVDLNGVTGAAAIYVVVVFDTKKEEVTIAEIEIDFALLGTVLEIEVEVKKRGVNAPHAFFTLSAIKCAPHLSF